VPIEAAIFLSRPGLVVAPFLEIGLYAVRQILVPSRFERRTRGLKADGAPVSLLARPSARIPCAAKNFLVRNVTIRTMLQAGMGGGQLSIPPMTLSRCRAPVIS
jgi:hypothetical protein